VLCVWYCNPATELNTMNDSMPAWWVPDSDFVDGILLLYWIKEKFYHGKLMLDVGVA
jgi:hypothetical protein